MTRAQLCGAWLRWGTGVMAAAVMGTTVVTVASAHGGDWSKVHACVEHLSGGVRIVAPDDGCEGGEKNLDWSWGADITAVNTPAGAGVAGGTDSGDATLAIAAPLFLSGVGSSESFGIIHALNTGTGPAISGRGDGGGVYGTTRAGYGVFAVSQEGIGLLAGSDGGLDGVLAGTYSGDPTRAAVRAVNINTAGYAGLFDGNAKVTGNLRVDGTITGTVVAPSSDRGAKDNFAAVDSVQVLERLATLPIESWRYQGEDPAVRHVGPMAQDFAAVFGVGQDDRHIATVDADGVAFAAIQGLYQVVQEKDAQLAAQAQRLTALDGQNAALEARLASLEQRVGGGGPPPLEGTPAGWPLVGGLVLTGLALRRRRK